MHMEVFEKYLFIAVKNLKHNYLPNLALSIFILLLTPVLFGINDLDAKATAVPLEVLVSLIGIILLTPVFAPEQKTEIREVVESKYTSYISVCILRTVTLLGISFLLITFFVLFMQASGCQITLSKYIFGTFAESLFLGSMGLLAYGISNNIAVGYMMPTVYYSLNFGGGSENLGKLYLFSMAKGSFEEKYWLFGFGVLLIILTFLFKSIVQKIR